MRLSPVHALVLASLVLPGCGGSSNKAGQHREETGERRPAAESEAGERGATQIPGSDREAFIAIGTASGAVRARAALDAEGRRERPGARSSTARARQILVQAHPRNTELVRLRRQTLTAVDAASGLPERRTARSLLALTDMINVGLREYAQRHPAIGGVIPD